MKNKIKAIACLLCTTALFSSCTFLDMDPNGKYAETSVLSDLTLANAYVSRQYLYVRDGFGYGASIYASDEVMKNMTNDGSNFWPQNQGQLTPDNMSPLTAWKDYFKGIAECNYFFAKSEGITGDPAAKARLVGEMIFLRAHIYAELMFRYGGVPIFTEIFDLNDPNMMNVKRDTYEKCVEWVTGQLDEAALALPYTQKGADFGRATKGAALALKARVLLYAASEQWNPSNSEVKWQAASDAAWAVIDLKDEGGKVVYSLDPSYGNIFKNPASPEIIYQRLYLPKIGGGRTTNFTYLCSPNGGKWNGWAKCCVSQDLVDAFEFEDGTMATDATYDGEYPTSTSEAAILAMYPGKYAPGETPWDKRDPRFYVSVLCDGQTFFEDHATLEATVESYMNSDLKTGGVNSLLAEAEAWNASKTGYTLRKFMDETVPTSVSAQNSGTSWIFSRLGEIYLNYAEAQYMLGHEDVAQFYLEEIRNRARGGKAGILPRITASGDLLMEAIQHERRVELAFEDHRYYDVRRWKIAEDTDNGSLRGIKVIKNNKAGNEHLGKKLYMPFVAQKRKFIAPQHYLLPISTEERRRNPGIEQNLGYSN